MYCLCSLILNPNGAYYESLKSTLKSDYEDLLWPEDAVFLERNSRTFKERSHTINQNTEALCDFLINHPKGKSGTDEISGCNHTNNFYSRQGLLS